MMFHIAASMRLAKAALLATAALCIAVTAALLAA